MQEGVSHVALATAEGSTLSSGPGVRPPCDGKRCWEVALALFWRKGGRVHCAHRVIVLLGKVAVLVLDAAPVQGVDGPSRQDLQIRALLTWLRAPVQQALSMRSAVQPC